VATTTRSPRAPSRREPITTACCSARYDIGKIGEGGHVSAGARIATETLEHIGVPGPTRDLAAFMVAEHLLIPDTATRRDLTDENLILDVAARIGSTDRLGALTLLA
jgi:[protein-PII] uridylyltransferase